MKIKFFGLLILSLFTTLLLFPVNTMAQPIVTCDKILFDAEYYEMNNPELVAIYGSGFDAMYRHYLEHGRAEGRLPYAGATTADTQTNFFYSVPSIQYDYSPGQITVNPDGKNIYVGDSRTYIMHQNIGDDGNSWIGIPGSSYDKFSTVASASVDGMNIAGKNIIILYGINDIMGQGSDAAFNNYNYFLQTKAQEWISKGAKVYFVNLCGVNNGLCDTVPGVTADNVKYINGNVAKFNSLMKSFPSNIKRINVNYGKNPEYDGIHYNAQTCISVYKQINKYL